MLIREGEALRIGAGVDRHLFACASTDVTKFRGVSKSIRAAVLRSIGDGPPLTTGWIVPKGNAALWAAAKRDGGVGGAMIGLNKVDARS